MGTGTGFTAPVNVEGPLALSLERSACGAQEANEASATPKGLYDIDGDGQPELIDWIPGNDPHWKVYRLKLPDGQAEVESRWFDVGGRVGVPAAGRLILIGNGYGGAISIGYKSAKADTRSLHQLPFPEIVVVAVGKTDSGSHPFETTTKYAYGGSELIFDSVGDRFVFPGYQRTVQVRGTDAANPRVGILTSSNLFLPAPFRMRPRVSSATKERDASAM
jgi:hypothetical protein